MPKITWTYCQKNSDLILSSGLNILLTNPSRNFGYEFSKESGNYLISDESMQWNYTGESNKITGRIKQHSKEKNSRFHKNYVAIQKDFKTYPQGLKIKDFEVRTLTTHIGRKELEAFGVSNIPADLNKFGKGGESEYDKDAEANIWNDTQANFTEILEAGEKKILAKKNNEWSKAKVPASAGIYWVEAKARGLIYIGESADLPERYKTHSTDTYFSALRRNIGENILNFKLQTKDGKKRYFSEAEDKKITEYLSECTIKTLAITFGRYELEELLISKLKPLLNR
ncbi:MAG: putative GIY-YIG superfamily endonuclease [Arenicella sp.]|jgi:predicted GIY-YIG superfamily endonuclease